MKVRCACGAKFSFEISEEMRTNPVRFTCPACGMDASEFVDGLIRRELGQATTPPGRVVVIQAALEPAESAAQTVAQPRATARVLQMQPIAQASIPQSPPAPAGPLRMRIERAQTSIPDTSAAAATDEPARCVKHAGELATEKCRICSKPICPKCMELFGYVCSPLCRARAESHGIEVPVYAGQRSVVEARRWRRVAWAAWSVGGLALLLVGFWIWYVWFGSAPKLVFSLRFGEPAYSGQSAFGQNQQLVFLHGGTLARHDLAQKKEIWSLYLINKDEIQAEVAKEIERAKAIIYKANNEAWEHVPAMPDPEKLFRSLERGEAASLELRVRGHNIWVISPTKLVRHDWDTGKAVQEIRIPEGYGRLIARGDELMMMNEQSGKTIIQRVNLTTCDSRTVNLDGESIGTNVPGAMPNAPTASASARTGQPAAGLPTGMPGRDAGKPMDPAKVAEQAQHMSLPARIALPAVIGNSWSQERTLNELEGGQRPKAQTASAAPAPVEHLTLIPSRDGLLEFSNQMLEEHIVRRSAMKPAAARSVLEGPVNVTQSGEVANEMLNEMQRERGGDVVEEDLSRYRVSLRRAGSKGSWTGEVIGYPSIYPLETVTVVAANKTIIVLDKDFKKLWQSSLNYPISGGLEALDPEQTSYGQGPCVERKDTLYVFDQGVLTAFDLKSGNARWRFISVGITGLFFDDRGMLYVNTTTASPESIKFSRQININQRTLAVVLKLDPATGKKLWSAEPGGLVNYVSGKYIYTMQSYAPEEEEDNPYQPETGFEARPYLRIKRLNPSNGHEMWEHFQQRAPLDVQFDKNTIRLVFKKEVQILRSLAF